MRVKLLIGFFVILCAFGILFYYHNKDQNHPYLDELILDNGQYETEDAVEIIKLLLDAQAGREHIRDQYLLKLSQNKNAIGYYANLILASRYDIRNNDAEEFYTNALNLNPTNDVRFNFASFLAKKGKTSDAIEEYLNILPENRALQALISLEVDANIICTTLIEKRSWKTIEEFLAPKIQSDPLLMKYYARALFEQEEYTKAIPFLEDLYNLDPDDSDVGWWYGRSLELTEQAERAKEIYSSIGTRGAYRLGVLLERNQQTNAAIEAYRSSDEAISLWRAGRMQEESGMTSKALETYLEIIEIESAYKDDAAYRAYILSNRLGRNATDKPLEILSEHPSWMKRIGKEYNWDSIPVVDYNKPEFLEMVELYEANGLENVSNIELSIGSRLATVEDKLALGDWYLEKEDVYWSVIWGLRSLMDEPSRRGYELSHPRPYEDLVLEAAEKYNIDANLIWAVMREESFYRHDVTSWAGAIGLMQIMPATGQDIASRLNKTIKDSDLLNPEININFGAFYIRSMLDMFSGDIDKAMAAYNGGPGNVSRWNNSPLGTTKEDFPTAITFFETQEYITKVKNSYKIYNWLYND
ncbi:UNVERIFIED_CONTAM: soluble lytic murein transglycosylase [Acetivibrio alkalicellulosi]